MDTVPEHQTLDQKGDSTDLIFIKRGCCCFWMPCFCSNRKTPWTVDIEERWWKKGWNAVKNVKDWSEIVAGPKWKTFIRRLNRKGGRHGKFQYDPLSYALNFDEGHGQNGNLEGESGYRDFSARYAAGARSSVDAGKDGPDSAVGGAVR